MSLLALCLLVTRAVLVCAADPLSVGRTAGPDRDTASTVGRVSYGYAPYAWIYVSSCDRASRWCRGRSAVGFALCVGSYDSASDICTHYCPGMTYAFWRPSGRWDPGTGATESTLLGAYVRRLDRASCLEIPGGFKCSDRLVADTPLNEISVALHASQRNRDYYFGPDPMDECDPDPQCAAFKVLRRTLRAPEKSRTWPDPDQVLTLRNSPYACVLAYVGLGDLESMGSCYVQLGPNCFTSHGSVFCIGEAREHRAGLTNGDPEASAPISMCGISRAATVKGRYPALGYSARDVRDFLKSSSCDAAVVTPASVSYGKDSFSVELDVATFHAVAEAGYTILRIPLGLCPSHSDPRGRAAYAAFVDHVAGQLSKVVVAVHAAGVLLDAADWGADGCKIPPVASLTEVASDLGAALAKRRALKLFLGLPRSRTEVRVLGFKRLLPIFDAFVTPAGLPDPDHVGHCQNMWAPEGDNPLSDRGVVSDLLTPLRLGVPANKVIFTLSLTGSLKITRVERAGSVESTEELSLADMEANTALKCEENIRTKCCAGSSVTVWARDELVNVSVTATSLETLKRYPELIAVAFGINQFVLTPVDSDWGRGSRSDAPAVLGITSAVRRLRDWKRQQVAAGVNAASAASGARAGGPRNARSIASSAPYAEGFATGRRAYKDPASGSKNCLDPQYSVGLSNTLVCNGLVAVHGALGVFKEPHRELYGTSYDKIYVANVYSLESCTPGEPARKVRVSSAQPQIAINVHTLSPTSDPTHYAVGILDSKSLVEYVPPISQLCASQSSHRETVRLNLVSVDGGYALDKPDVQEKRGVILKPVEVLHFVSNFTPGVDYINLNVSCVTRDASALQPCLVAVCGGDSGCRKDYGRVCDTAHEIIDDARRAGEMLAQGLEELTIQERKAKMYELPDAAPLPWLDPGPRPARVKRLISFGVATAAMALAVHVSGRVGALEEQMDYFKRSMVDVQGRMVEVSRKLNDNIALVNGRIDEQEKQMLKNTEAVNSNFALLKEAMGRNNEAAMLDTNTKFAVTISYQMWYAQMQSVTHQLTQAAMQMKFLSRGVENCLRQIASKRSGSCPSGMSAMLEHPGLSDFPTVGAALYRDRKLFIVHSVPGTVEITPVRGVIPLPRISTDEVPCWPDYTAWLIRGEYYEPSECHGKYCHEPKVHERLLRCLSDQNECKTVCAHCHRGICYSGGKFTWVQGSATVQVDSPPLKRLARKRISEGPVTFLDLLRTAGSRTPELALLRAVNTSAKLESVRRDLDNVSDLIREFDKRYEEMSAQRVSFGGWLSGLASNIVLWFWVAALTLWCGGISAVVAMKLFFPTGGQARGKFHKRNKFV